jgi:hypothetical protein
LYVYKGDFNHFEYKLCQTKPNSENQKMNITIYMTNRYDDNSGLLQMQKQTQTKPNQSQFQPAVRGAKPKQTQPVVSLSNQQSQLYSAHLTSSGWRSWTILFAGGCGSLRFRRRQSFFADAMKDRRAMADRSLREDATAKV